MWLYAVWGFVGAAVNCGIVFAEAVRRVKGWPWTFPHGPGGAPYAAAVVTDLAGGAATSAALSSSDMMTPNILLAFLIGAATPAVLKKARGMAAVDLARQWSGRDRGAAVMNIREFGYRYLTALAGATPAFTRAAAEEHRGFGYRYLTALAGTTPAFTALPGDQYRDRGDAPEATTTVYYFDRGGDYGGFSRGFSGIGLRDLHAGRIAPCPPPKPRWVRLAQVAAVVCAVIATVVLLPLILNARSDYQQAVVLANAAEARLTALAPTEYAGGVGAAGVVRVWNSSGEVVGTFSVPAAQSTAMTLAPDGGTVAIAGGSTVTLFDRSGRSLATAEAGAAVTSMAFSPDGTALAIATGESTQLWDSALRQLRRQLHGHVGMVTAMASSPDGRGLATASTDDTVRIWDIATGQQTGRHLGAMTSMAYSPDGRHLATAGAGEEVYVWDARTLQQVATLHTGLDPVSSLAYSPDGKTIRVTGVRARKVELKKIEIVIRG